MLSRSNTIRLTALLLAFTGLATAAALWGTAPVSAAGSVAPSSPEFYTQNVQPILQTNCYRCHGGGLNHRGGLSMNTKENLMRGGKSGADIVPGDPTKSLLTALINHAGPADDPKPMPPKSKLSDADIATITAWIKAGAVMPPDPK